MRVKIERYEIERKRNVLGKVVSSRHEYIIKIQRWFKRPRYLRLLPGWLDAIHKGGPVDVELTRSRYKATTFRDDGKGNDLRLAKKVASALKENPDWFIID